MARLEGGCAENVHLGNAPYLVVTVPKPFHLLAYPTTFGRYY